MSEDCRIEVNIWRGNYVVGTWQTHRDISEPVARTVVNEMRSLDPSRPAPQSACERAMDVVRDKAALAELSTPKPALGPFRAEKTPKCVSWTYKHDDLPDWYIYWDGGVDTCYVYYNLRRVGHFHTGAHLSVFEARMRKAAEAKFAELIAEEEEKGRMADGIACPSHPRCPWWGGPSKRCLEDHLYIDQSNKPVCRKEVPCPKPQPEPDAGETFTVSFSQGIWTYRDKRVPDKRVDWSIASNTLTIWWNLTTRATKQDTVQVSKQWAAEMMACTYLNRHATGKLHF